ncbi:MAG: DUF2878 family protein [Candidatus Aenigmarchaeota archaeon]|nr:DUF2878 family protein [Candidatus Aenigmarchaeota archaeon]
MKNLLKAFLYSIILAFLTLFSVSILWQRPLALTAVLIVLSIAMLLIWRNREDLYLYVIVSIAGALAESFAIGFSVWSYSVPDFMGIPVWLPFLWGIAGLLIKRITLEIHDFIKKPRKN